ncbi:putative transcriptional regulator [Candidatus Nitrososphaera evergladensis SR1]|uniref:Putative transcriptional regulator n=1 Tax=Candidatus Nitrososphaera evergladensis SR1 TaxID=1459636 RepID=A0A075N245_9ARCH|nr:winged helix-turn-helix domain-containing protein [Candidatus Nitrososphaera evergladensis]AIF85519.1 putative transcriptional regulator [Candidatus Nitrososphaera evergladensis SR1]
MKNRSRLDIAAAVLDIAESGARKTEIMYQAFLSFPQLEEYLEILQSRGMLEYTAGKKRYNTTKEGKKFLQGYKEVGRFLMPQSNKLTTPEINELRQRKDMVGQWKAGEEVTITK